ncbi:MAG: nucleotide pyrophosphohydrolase [Erysipelotrichales bacterium]|nr:MAG: nucleotide pyrophosphohydrolase [Erysipelotrichales bacterium]
MTKLEELTNEIRIFCDERDWTQFHTPKDLAIGMVGEAVELLEIFRYRNLEESISLIDVKREAIGDELADVFFHLLRFADLYAFDLGDELRRKMILNAVKYPAEKVRGKNLKYDEYE